MYKFLLLLNRLWRLVITCVFFILFGVGALLLSVVWFNLLNYFVKNPKKRNDLTQLSIRGSFKFFLFLTKLLGVIDYRIINVEKLYEDGGCIVVANHPSLLDYVFLASLMPNCTCIVKQALLNNFFMKGVIKAAGYIPNTDPEQLLNDCYEHLQANDTILIFPEGTRTEVGDTFKLQRGAANIALRCQVDIRVVSIHCSEPFLTKNKKWYHTPLFKPVFLINVQDKVLVKPFIGGKNKALTLEVRRLTDYLARLLAPNIEK